MISSRQKQDPRMVRRKRAMWWSFVIMLSLAVALPLISYQGSTTAQAAADNWENPRANYWRSVREGDAGYTSVQGDESGVLIQNGGQNWRVLRNGLVANIGGWIIVFTLVALALFYLKKGQIKLDRPRSGRKVQRWTGAERFLHWYTASLFVLLGITGLSLMFGRVVLIPLLGKDGFAGFASLAKTVHDYLGPLFIIGVVVIIVSWMKHNFINETDKQWFKQGGGIIGKGHPSAGRMNGGEKVWFWVVTCCGIVVSVSGLILDFPNYDQVRETMQNANLVHGIFALIFIAGAFGHIYIGTIGTEGALEGMVTGEVDETWAKQHHDLWYQEVAKEAPSGGTTSSA